jgi:hypothetical protein
MIFSNVSRMAKVSTYPRYSVCKGPIRFFVLRTPWTQGQRVHEIRSLIGRVVPTGSWEVEVLPPKALVFVGIECVIVVHAHRDVKAAGVVSNFNASDSPVPRTPMVAKLLIAFPNFLQHFIFVKREAMQGAELLNRSDGNHVDFVRLSI